MRKNSRKTADQGLVEKEFKQRLVLEGAVDFRSDTVILPNGRKATRAFMDHSGAVAILPVLDDGRIVFVHQYRYPVKQVTLEIPAGKLNSDSDSPLGRAKAELKEETGYTAARMKPLISFWPTTAFSSEVLHIFTAAGLKGGTSCPDEDEFLRLESMPFEKAWKLVKKGVIKDAKTIIALQAWKIKLLEKP